MPDELRGATEPELAEGHERPAAPQQRDGGAAADLVGESEQGVEDVVRATGLDRALEIGVVDTVVEP